MASDKRDSERVELLGALHGEVMVFQPSDVRQMSHGGMQVETGFPLQLDSLHDFRLTLGERSVVVRAVSRTHASAMSIKTSSPIARASNSSSPQITSPRRSHISSTRSPKKKPNRSLFWV